nr:MAG TPA: hypothetical protein [Caudoviricetes sp.]
MNILLTSLILDEIQYKPFLTSEVYQKYYPRLVPLVLLDLHKQFCV